MSEYLRLPQDEQLQLLNVVSGLSGLSIQAVEKDIWLCWTLNELITLQGPVRLVFKGGTSLSKAFGAIHRFSEDVDVTLNYFCVLGTLPTLETAALRAKMTIPLALLKRSEDC